MHRSYVALCLVAIIIIVAIFARKQARAAGNADMAFTAGYVMFIAAVAAGVFGWSLIDTMWPLR